MGIIFAAILFGLIFCGKANSQISVFNINGHTEIQLDGHPIDLNQPYAVRYEDDAIKVISPESWPDAKITLDKRSGNVMAVEYKGSFFEMMSPEEAQMHVHQQIQQISSSMAVLQEHMKHMADRLAHMFS
ncbi:Hypothetical protein NTJ_00608 [Nesidiocoris tenuis]|uniref:PEGA domain-containing protein n=1 Tax=Nesidiocoris tenuis TaxID=355587 RepID=A0ABN7A786_9HEMI|nr:Hypothetical protein NTJ_00608 [Nesidiocoris tenuis]